MADAVEDDAHQLAIAIDQWAAGVAADDVGVQTKFIGVPRSKRFLFSIQLFGRANGSSKPCSAARRYAPAIVVQAGACSPSWR